MEELLKIEDGQLTVKAVEKVNEFIKFEKYKKEMEYRIKLFREELLEKMDKLGIDKFMINELSVTRREGSLRTTIDTKRLKDELPDIYHEYSKTSEVKPSLVISVSD